MPTGSKSIRLLYELENIEEMRAEGGIEDVELRNDIRRLAAGDLVQLTFRCGASSWETLPVRITSIKRPTFRGKLTRRPATAGLRQLKVGSLVTFNAAHIHSVPKGIPAHAKQPAPGGRG